MPHFMIIHYNPPFTKVQNLCKREHTNTNNQFIVNMHSQVLMSKTAMNRAGVMNDDLRWLEQEWWIYAKGKMCFDPLNPGPGFLGWSSTSGGGGQLRSSLQHDVATSRSVLQLWGHESQGHCVYEEGMSAASSSSLAQAGDGFSQSTPEYSLQQAVIT